MAQSADQPENPSWQFSLRAMMIAVTVASPFLLMLRFSWGRQVCALLGFMLIYFFLIGRICLWFNDATKGTTRKRVGRLILSTLIVFVLLRLLFDLLLPGVRSYR